MVVGMVTTISLQARSKTKLTVCRSSFDTACLALLYKALHSTVVRDDPPKQPRHERSRQTTLWIPRRTFLVREPEDRLLRVVCCSRIIHHSHLLLGTVSWPTSACDLPLSLTLMDFSSILTLAISRHWNPLPILRRTRLSISIWRTVLYWVVTLQRMYVLMSGRAHI